MSIRLAILEADTPMPGTLARIGPYFNVFSSLLTSAISPTPLSPTLTLSRYNILDDPSSYPPLDAIDGLLITGSKHNAMDDDEWIVKLVAFTKEAMEKGKKVVGVCFGHQIVGRALGRPVLRSEKGWEVSVTEVELSEEGKRVFGLTRDKMQIFQMHRDYVDSLPEGARSLASTQLCPVQGFYIPDKCITVQGHPEFTSLLVKEVVQARHEAGVFDEDMYKSAMDRLEKDHDGVAIAKSFVKFLKGEL